MWLRGCVASTSLLDFSIGLRLEQHTYAVVAWDDTLHTAAHFGPQGWRVMASTVMACTFWIDGRLGIVVVGRVWWAAIAMDRDTTTVVPIQTGRALQARSSARVPRGHVRLCS